jgi:hypothetical protein
MCVWWENFSKGSHLQKNRHTAHAPFVHCPVFCFYSIILINVVSLSLFQVKKLCGAPSLHQTDKPVGTEVDVPLHHVPGNKWNSPPDTQMLQFLVSLHKPTEFFMRIADRYVVKISPKILIEFHDHVV